MDWEMDNERPIYTQLVELMERAVVSGEFAPGERLPGVRELAAQAGVNPNTMQRALAQLENEGLAQSQRTSGRFVTEDEERIAALREKLAQGATRRYLAEMEALGCTREETAGYIEKARREMP